MQRAVFTFDEHTMSNENPEKLSSIARYMPLRVPITLDIIVSILIAQQIY